MTMLPTEFAEAQAKRVTTCLRKAGFTRKNQAQWPHSFAALLLAAETVSACMKLTNTPGIDDWEYVTRFECQRAAGDVAKQYLGIDEGNND